MNELYQTYRGQRDAEVQELLTQLAAYRSRVAICIQMMMMVMVMW